MRAGSRPGCRSRGASQHCTGRTWASLRAAAVARMMPPASPTAVPPSSVADVGRPMAQAPAAKKSGVADTKSRECAKEVACVE